MYARRTLWKLSLSGVEKLESHWQTNWSGRDHNVVMVDTSAERPQSFSEDIDAIKLVGNGASISTQLEAGVQTADILIAVTGSDELNLFCCLIAKKAGKCHTIARVRNPVYSNEIGFIKEQLGISMIINPELAAPTEISEFCASLPRLRLTRLPRVRWSF